MEAEYTRDRVLNRIRSDSLAADTRLSLFIAACESYRHDSILRPFPPPYIKTDGRKDVDSLLQLCRTFPALRSLVKGKQILSEDGWSLLDWILDKNFTLTSLAKTKFKEIEQKTGQASYTTQPDFVFELDYSESNSNSAKFEELSKSFGTLYAYHGSRLDNFHSILHNGLHAHLNKNSLFGEGTYLSSDLSVCMPYSVYGSGWCYSRLGQRLSCVAVCQVLDHPGVKCTVQSNQNGSPSRTRARARNSMGGDVPERYYVVTNNELIRVKYLLVYAEKKKAGPVLQNCIMFRYPFASIVVLYIIVLLLLGLSRTRGFQNLYKKYIGDS